MTPERKPTAAQVAKARKIRRSIEANGDGVTSWGLYEHLREPFSKIAERRFDEIIAQALADERELAAGKCDALAQHWLALERQYRADENPDGDYISTAVMHRQAFESAAAAIRNQP